MNYGFAIDTRACIGCHACSVACKSENQVPLGVHRTWVKYSETGQFPDTRRAFQVTRCNHCKNPPCVRICPVAAMYQRPDGIVAFSGDACIGCKACLQACPYDAIYVDPDSGTAAKCHYCGHRVEQGMEPACVVVCPTHAILAGDLDDPGSEIARVVSQHDVSVRKPEQGTLPKLFYIEGNTVSLDPTALPRTPPGLAFGETLSLEGRPTSPAYADAAAYGPIAVAPGKAAGQFTRQVTYAPFHRVPWHWPVPAYLVTKAIGCGVFLWTGFADLDRLTTPYTLEARAVAEGIGLLALVLTSALLVLDLERPERFLRILLRPQWRSWLTRGAFVLVALSIVATVMTAIDVARVFGAVEVTAGLEVATRRAVIPLAALGAAYTGFLFGQCEGRDLWQSRLLPVQLLVRALIAGLATLDVVGAVMPPRHFHGNVGWLLAATLFADLLLTAIMEWRASRSTPTAKAAARAMLWGRYAWSWWGAGTVVGYALPLGSIAVTGLNRPDVTAAVAVLVGLYAREHAFVMAAQEVPNS